MSRISRLIVLSALLSVLTACQRQPAEPLPRLPADLATLTVPEPEPATGRHWEGVVEAARQVDISAQTTGRVVEVTRDVNDPVEAGDVLVRLSEVEQRAAVASARAALHAAQAALEEAESTRRRYLELAQKQFVSAAQLDQVNAARDTALAARDAATARIADATQQATYTLIRAPHAGIVAARHIEPGESVASGQPLLRLLSTDALRIEVNVPQSVAATVHKDTAARVVLADGSQVDAVEVTVYPSADPISHSVRVRVTLPPLDHAPRPGGTAQVSFDGPAGAGYPRIPVACLVRRGELQAVYVLFEGRLSLRQVRLGARHGDEVDVLAGLRAGESVAVDPVAAAQALAHARAGSGWR